MLIYFQIGPNGNAEISNGRSVTIAPNMTIAYKKIKLRVQPNGAFGE
jgi:hypothetical protein